MKKTELISIGGAYIDINAPDFPLGSDGLSLESETVGGRYLLEPGGSAVNLARACSALDIPAVFVGKVGKDRLGSIFSELLIHSQVKPALVVSEDVLTNVSFNMVESSGQGIMTVVGTANQSLTPEEVYAKASEDIRESSYLFLGGCFKLKKLMPAFLKLADDTKSSDTKVVLDHAKLNKSVTEEEKETVRQLALRADIYLPSSDEFRELWGVTTIEEGLKLLQQKGYSGIVVVKDSENGAVSIINGKVTRVPAFPVRLIHSVGAGDSFNAGFIASQHKGDELTQSIKFGCASAALKISTETLPTYRDVVVYLAAHDS